MDRPLDTETDLVRRARSGDPEAFGTLVRAHQELAFRTAWLLAGSTAEAEDAAQEAFVKAWRALPRFRESAPFRPWLLAIVANEARNRRRSAGRREGLALRAGAVAGRETPPVGPEAAALAGEDRAWLVAGLELLGDRDREVLALRFLLDLGEAETATALGCRRGTVKSRTSRALDRLRAALEQHAEDDR